MRPKAGRAKQHHPTGNETFRSLDLPFELRQEIYYHALTLDTSTLTTIFSHYASSSSSTSLEYWLQERLISTTQYLALQAAITEFNSDYIQRHLIGSLKMLYVEVSHPHTVTAAIMLKFGLAKIAYNLRGRLLDPPKEYVHLQHEYGCPAVG